MVLPHACIVLPGFHLSWLLITARTLLLLPVPPHLILHVLLPPFTPALHADSLALFSVPFSFSFFLSLFIFLFFSLFLSLCLSLITFLSLFVFLLLSFFLFFFQLSVAVSISVLGNDPCRCSEDLSQPALGIEQRWAQMQVQAPSPLYHLSACLPWQISALRPCQWESKLPLKGATSKHQTLSKHQTPGPCLLSSLAVRLRSPAVHLR